MKVSTTNTIEWAIKCESCLTSLRNRVGGKVDPIHKHGIKRRSIMFQLLYYQMKKNFDFSRLF